MFQDFYRGGGRGGAVAEWCKALLSGEKLNIKSKIAGSTPAGKLKIMFYDFSLLSPSCSRGQGSSLKW